MSANFSDLHARYEMVLGGVCPVPSPRASESYVGVAADSEKFEKLFQHWLGLPAASLPCLRGLAKSRGTEESFELVVDAGGKTPFLLISVLWRGPRPFPRVSQIWPYAAWWEEELRGFESARIEASHKDGGIAWRRN